MTRESKVAVQFMMASILFFAGIVALVFALAHSCSIEPKYKEPPIAAPPVGQTCDGVALGSIRELVCPPGESGKLTEACTVRGWLPATDTCQTIPATCGRVQFTDVVSTLQQYCATCHASIVQYAVAQSWALEIGRRIALPQGNNDHMPQGPSPQLNQDQVSELKQWVDDGAIQDCTEARVPSTINEDYIATQMVNDAASLPQADRPFTRYLILAGAINGGISGEALQTWIDAMNKGLNGLNNSGQNLFAVQSIELSKSVWRWDIRNYGMSRDDVAQIEAADVNINIVDNTSKGVVLQALLQTRKPWLHADNFLDLTYRNSRLYYTLVNVPAKLADLQRDIGVNFARDLANLVNVRFIGSAQSPIAEQKNRLIIRDVQARSQNAYYWETRDVNAIPSSAILVSGTIVTGSSTVRNLSRTTGLAPGQAVAGRGIARGTVVVNISGNTLLLNTAAVESVQNDALTLTGRNTKDLFQEPLIAGTGGGNGSIASVGNYTADASETIWQFPNGMQGYGLWDGVGNRVNFADPGIVIDTATPLGNRVINNANSCSRCHNIGTIPFIDQILAHVTTNAAQFVANDVALVRAVYKEAPTNAALFRVDNAQYTQALQRLGIRNGTDPMSVVTDRYLQNWDLTQVSGFLGLSPEEFLEALNTSPTAKTALGTLYTRDGTVTFVQFTGALQDLIRDARLFQDEL